MTSEVNLNSIFTQLSLRKIAFFGSSILGNDIYFLKEFIDLMINIIGEETLIEMLKKDNSRNKKINNLLGENWEKPTGMKRTLKKFDMVIEKTKTAYDLLENQEIDKKQKDRTLKYQLFSQKAKKIPVIKPDVYSLFIFLVNNTSIKRMTIPQEYFKILEHKGYRSMDEFDKRRVGDANRQQKQ